MWKVVLADDEQLILSGLKKLINWEKLEAEPVGEASNGEMLLGEIREKKPDIVITDIMMPKMTGLEVMKQSGCLVPKPQFIFISGYQEFSYAQEALSCGAVDYLLKPVSRKDLEASLCKAVKQIRTENTAEIFMEEKRPVFSVSAQTEEDAPSVENNLEKFLYGMDLDLAGKEFCCIVFGLLEEQSPGFDGFSAEKQSLVRFSVMNAIYSYFENHRLGFCVGKQEDQIRIMGIYPKGQGDVYLESTVMPLKAEIEMEKNVRLRIGIGLPAEDTSRLPYTYKTASFAYDLYYFEEKPILNFADIHKDFTVSFDDIAAAMEAVFKSIIAKDGQFMRRLTDVLHMIGEVHYGNRTAASSRIMMFAGDLNMKLHQNHMLGQDFYARQDMLQDMVMNASTFREAIDNTMHFYEQLLPVIYDTVGTKDRMQIEKVKDYIRENYNQPLSIKELANVAYVSPNYFSVLFKTETGQNYKAYLTKIRMEKALQLLLESDYKTYEIAEKVGYNNVRRFVEAFKNEYSVSPMEYKKAKNRA